MHRPEFRAIVPPASSLLRPEQRPDAVELVFSSSGRLSRLPFCAGLGTVLAVLWLYDRWVVGWPRALSGFAVLAVLLFSACCLLSRRLHDLDRAGWWAGAIVAVFLLARVSLLHGPASAIAILVFAWLAAAPGQGVANRFGPPLPRRA